MNIIKKSGRVEEFDISKVRRSVSNASIEINQPMTDSDLKVIENEVLKILKDLKREKTSSYEIFSIVLNVLKKLNFNAVGKAYFNGSIDF